MIVSPVQFSNREPLIPIADLSEGDLLRSFSQLKTEKPAKVFCCQAIFSIPTVVFIMLRERVLYTRARIFVSILLYHHLQPESN